MKKAILLTIASTMIALSSHAACTRNSAEYRSGLLVKEIESHMYNNLKNITRKSSDFSAGKQEYRHGSKIIGSMKLAGGYLGVLAARKAFDQDMKEVNNRLNFLLKSCSDFVDKEEIMQQINEAVERANKRFTEELIEENN